VGERKSAPLREHCKEMNRRFISLTYSEAAACPVHLKQRENDLLLKMGKALTIYPAFKILDATGGQTYRLKKIGGFDIVL
jgi:hypothetical protein